MRERETNLIFAGTGAAAWTMGAGTATGFFSRKTNHSFCLKRIPVRLPERSFSHFSCHTFNWSLPAAMTHEQKLNLSSQWTSFYPRFPNHVWTLSRLLLSDLDDTELCLDGDRLWYCSHPVEWHWHCHWQHLQRSTKCQSDPPVTVLPAYFFNFKAHWARETSIFEVNCRSALSSSSRALVYN